MDELRVVGRKIKKSFSGRTIFSDVSFELACHEGLGVVGKNGAGKSTLAKIVAALLSPTDGTIDVEVSGEKVAQWRRHEFVGFVAPYLQLYEEFSAWENLDIFRRIRGLPISDKHILSLLERVGLALWKADTVRTYSSGMKQRLKYASALLHQPPLLILDEPRSNLDSEGIEIINEIMEQQVDRGILVVATNEKEDLQSCQQIIDLEIYA